MKKVNPVVELWVVPWGARNSGPKFHYGVNPRSYKRLTTHYKLIAI